MTSAQNRRRPLNGSSCLIAGIVLVILGACTASKHAHKSHPAPAPSKPRPETVTIFDPVSGEDREVPKNAVKVDTVYWTQDPAPPLVTDVEPTEIKPDLKTHFDIALLIPFNSTSADMEESIDSRTNRFLQYYGGMSIAAAESDSMHYPVTIHTFDVDDAFTDPEKFFVQQNLTAPDVIVGPYRKEDILTTSRYGLHHESMVVSPWLPVFTPTENNPGFIQTVPGLTAHAQAISDHLIRYYAGRKIFLVARDVPVEINRLSLFKKNPQLHTEDFIVKDDSPDLVDTNLKELLSDQGTVFILPYYAKSDEGFINSFLRKLHAEKDAKEVTVFGLPQWVSFYNLTSNYLESLRVHLSVSAFTDVSQPDYTAFRQKFFSAYHTAPDLQAFLGYDLMKWINRTLVTKGGQDGMITPASDWNGGLASGFRIRPVFKSGSTGSGEMNQPMYYENEYIRIVEYREGDYQLSEEH